MASRNKLITCIGFLSLWLAGCSNDSASETADLILTNAYVYTADESQSVAEAVAVRGNQIVFVGSADEAQSFVGNDTDVRDMNGAMLMPGIHDMHIHALGTVEPDSCDLGSESHSLEGLVPVLQQCITDYNIDEGDWLIVLQWAFSVNI